MPPPHPHPPFSHTSTHRKTAAGVGNFAAVEVRAVEHPKVLAVNVYVFIFVCMFAYMYICICICYVYAYVYENIHIAAVEVQAVEPPKVLTANIHFQSQDVLQNIYVRV